MPYNYIKIEGQILSKKGKIAQKIIVADNVKPQNYNFISIKSDANFKTNIFSSKSKSYISLRSGMIYPEIDNPERFNYIVLKEIIGSEINANVVSNLDLKHAKYKSNYITILPQTFTTKLITVPNILDLHFIVPPPKEPSEIIIEPYKQDFIIGDMVSSLSLVGLQLFYEFFSNAYDLGSATKYNELFGNIYNLIRLDNLVNNSGDSRYPLVGFLASKHFETQHPFFDMLKLQRFIDNSTGLKNYLRLYNSFQTPQIVETALRTYTTRIDKTLINSIKTSKISSKNTTDIFAHAFFSATKGNPINVNLKAIASLSETTFYNYLFSYLFKEFKTTDNFLHKTGFEQEISILNVLKTLRNVPKDVYARIYLNALENPSSVFVRNILRTLKNENDDIGVRNILKILINTPTSRHTTKYIYSNKSEDRALAAVYLRNLSFVSDLLVFNKYLINHVFDKKTFVKNIILKLHQNFERTIPYYLTSRTSQSFRLELVNRIVPVNPAKNFKRNSLKQIISKNNVFDYEIINKLLGQHSDFDYYTAKRLVVFDSVFQTGLKKTKYNYITLTQEYSVYTDKKYNWISIKPSFIKSKYNYIRIFDVPSKDDVKYIAFPFKPCTEVENDKLQIVVYLNDGRTVTFDLRLHKLIPIVSDMANIKNEVNHKIVLKGKEGAFIPEFEPAYIKAVDANIPGVEEIMRQLGFLDDIPTT